MSRSAFTPFEHWVDGRLHEWGRGVSGGADCYPAQVGGENMIWRLMHGNRSIGAAPMTPDDAQIEEIVMRIAQRARVQADVLRISYLPGLGRLRFERFDLAREKYPGLNRTRFFAMKDLAFSSVVCDLRALGDESRHVQAQGFAKTVLSGLGEALLRASTEFA